MCLRLVISYTHLQPSTMSEVHSKAQTLNWGFGILGVVILTIIASTLASVGTWLWVDREPKLIFPVPDASALVTIDLQQNEIAKLKTQFRARTA